MVRFVVVVLMILVKETSQVERLRRFLSAGSLDVRSKPTEQLNVGAQTIRVKAIHRQELLNMFPLATMRPVGLKQMAVLSAGEATAIHNLLIQLQTLTQR